MGDGIDGLVHVLHIGRAHLVAIDEQRAVIQDSNGLLALLHRQGHLAARVEEVLRHQVVERQDRRLGLLLLSHTIVDVLQNLSGAHLELELLVGAGLRSLGIVIRKDGILQLKDMRHADKLLAVVVGLQVLLGGVEVWNEPSVVLPLIEHRACHSQQRPGLVTRFEQIALQ